MLNRIIRIMATAAACALLLAGCSIRLDNPAQIAGGSISFNAGSALLLDDAKLTKTGTLKTGTSFTTGDAFIAWAWHFAAQQHFTFGATTPITLGSGGDWDYAPHQFWNWYEEDDHYDFLAIYPADKDITHTAATLSNPNLKATILYDATDDQYDLMAAGYRRDDKTITQVPLTFNHMLSAVSVRVLNSSNSVNSIGDPLTITLKSCQFVNLVTESSISVTFTGLSLSVQNTGNPNTTPALGPSIPANTELAPGEGYPTVDEWDLMIPQNLNLQSGDLPPVLRIVYNKGEEDITEDLPLKDIKNATTNEPITSWEQGVKYNYQIELRLGVGIVVTVETTPWEIVEAQTPGLMI